jgi:putative intracellular protease/amidase
MTRHQVAESCTSTAPGRLGMERVNLAHDAFGTTGSTPGHRTSFSFLLDWHPQIVEGQTLRNRHEVERGSANCWMARSSRCGTLQFMSYIFSSRLTARTLPSRIPARVQTAGRFILHFAEMWIAMLFGMMLFMAIPGVMGLPALMHQVGMAVAMTVPMVAWMRVRGHSLRHGIDMAAAMLIPWALVLAAANVLPWLADAGTASMALGMLAIILFRREHFVGSTHHGHDALHAEHKRGRRIKWSRIFLVSAYAMAIVLAPAILGTANLATKVLAPGAVEPVRSPSYSGVLPAPPALDPSKKIAVVISGPRGVEIGDAMEAFEVLARSDLYNVYTVAPERKPLTLNPGPSLGGSSINFVPHFSFADYDAQIGRAPDVLAIPYFDTAYTPEGDAATLDWIRTHFGANTPILGICSGNIILADTGLVAGRNATTNTGTFDRVQSASPTTNWLHNVRDVDDGNIVTASNLTSGIAGALHLVDREAGRAKALDVARQIGYTPIDVLDDPRFDPTDESLAPRLADAALSGRTEKLGILMYDGMTELGLSGIVDPLLGSFAVRTYGIAPEQRIIRTRNGLDLLPRYSFESAPTLDGVVFPAGENDSAKQQAEAAWSATEPGRPALDLYRTVGQGESAYDVSFRDLAQRQNRLLAQHIANVLFYPADTAHIPGGAWPIREALALIGLMLVGAAVVLVATRVRLPRRGRLEPIAQPA